MDTQWRSLRGKTRKKKKEAIFVSEKAQLGTIFGRIPEGGRQRLVESTSETERASLGKKKGTGRKFTRPDYECPEGLDDANREVNKQSQREKSLIRTSKERGANNLHSKRFTEKKRGPMEI